MTVSLTTRLSQRLSALRAERDLTLEELAAQSGLSRAALSRMEKAEVSPTAEQLGKLCAAYGLTMSRLLAMVEESFPACVPEAEQPVWQDRGFTRRVVSPGSAALAGEVLDCTLAPDSDISYHRPPVADLEHHLVLLTGRLAVTLDDRRHDLAPGDALRYRLSGASRFQTPPREAARYMLFLVTP